MTGKQLKNSILQWAIQGKLVPQDPNDEPASVLLEKIRAEKARLIKKGKIKKDKKESIIFRGEDNSYYEKFADGKVVCIDEEIPFEIPESWEWCRMQEVIEFINGRAYKKEELLSRGKYKVLRVGNFFTNDSWYYSDLELPEDKYCFKGDLLYAWSASFGPQIWEGDKTIFHYHIWNVKYNREALRRDYLNYFLLADKAKIKGSTTGSTMIHVSMENMKPRFIPIPPINEQLRIVSQLNATLPEVEKYERLNEQYDFLNSNIGLSLRKSILQEAIQGRLIPQDSNDEPASILLQRIKEEKLRLVKVGKLKKKDIIDSTIFKGDDNKYFEKKGKDTVCIDEELPFEIPSGWAWSRLSGVVNIIMGQSPDGNDVFEANEEDNAYEFHQGKICFTDKYIAPSGKWCKEPSRIADIGSLLICVRAPIGDVNITQRQIGIGRGLAAITGYNGIQSDFLFYWLLAHKKILVDKGTGSTFKAITVEVLKDLIIPIPPLAEQQRIVTQIKTLYDRIKG